MVKNGLLPFLSQVFNESVDSNASISKHINNTYSMLFLLMGLAFSAWSVSFIL
jgi:hypothetical protein